MCGVYSNVADMSRYLIALLNHGRIGDFQLLKPETLEFMFTPHFEVDPRLDKIGVIFFIYNMFGHHVLGHDGANPGFGTQLYFAPEDNLGIIVFANIMNNSAYQIGDGMMKLLFNYQEPAKNFAEAKNFWPGFVGDYGSPEPDFLTDFRFLLRDKGIYKVRIKQDGLRLEFGLPGTSYRLRQVKPDDPYLYEIVAPNKENFERLVFVPGKDGKAGSLKIMLNEYVRLTGEARTRAYLMSLAVAGIPEIF